MVLESNLHGKNDKLEFFKWMAAILVIFSHSFALVGKAEIEWLYYLTFGQIDFGGFAVAFFLFFSGLLVSKSLMKKENESFFTYMKKRCIRIFPPLIVTVIMTVFLLGPFMTQGSIKEYFTNIKTYKYFLNALLIMQHDLPEVFQNNICMSSVNGALWTLPVEFLCYIGCYIMKKVGCYNKKILRVLSLFVILFWIILCSMSKNIVIIRVVRAGMFFLMGICFYVYRDSLVLSKKYGVSAFLLLVIADFLKILNTVIVILLPYLLVVMIYGEKNEKNKENKIAVLGKYSYTIYLCAFPIQQMLISLHGGNMNSYCNFIEATVLSIVIGWLIFVIAEKPFRKV